MAEQYSDKNASNPCARRKVKSGCQTCRRRKVKCDESWPVCNRCNSTGRTCDGYGTWGGGSQACSLPKPFNHNNRVVSKISSPDIRQVTSIQAISLVSLPTNEKDAFEWFMCRSALKLPGMFISNYWNTLLFQASTTEPSIRHALLALSSAHREEVRSAGSLGQEHNDTLALFTVAQYSKAIRHLQPCFNDSRKASIHVALISCLLFVSTEFLRGHYTNGLLHLENGLNLLLDTGLTSQDQGYQSICVDGWLITLFTRLLVQAKLLGQMSGFPCRKFLGFGQQTTSITFRSIHHARRGLEHIMLRAMDIQEQSLQLKFKSPHGYESNALFDQQSILQKGLRTWLHTYEATVPTSSVTLFSRDHFAYQLLRFFYNVAAVQVDTCLEPFNEMQFDQHEPIFIQIISFCIEAHKVIYPNGKRTQHPQAHQDPEPNSPNSVSDIGWIAPLYFTAVKCRNHRLRHQAIRLLESSVQREGIWSAVLAVVVARKVAEIEEGEFYGVVGKKDHFEKLELPTKTSFIFPTLPADRRVSNIGIILPDDRAGKLLLSCHRREVNGVVQWISLEYNLRTKRWADGVWSEECKSMSFRTKSEVHPIISVR